MPSLYDVLEVSRNAGKQEIKAAYKRLAFKYHPDRNPNNPFAEEYFKKINEAYHILSNDTLKKNYDFAQTQTYTPPTPTYTPTQTYEPYINDYDPANFVSKSMQFKIQVFSIVFLVLFALGAVFAHGYFNTLNARKNYEMAVEFLQKGEKTAALIRVGAALRFDPELSEAYLLRAKINSEHFRNYFNAMHDYLLGIKYAKQPSADMYFKMALCNFKLYDFDTAILDFDKAISMNKKEGEYYLYRGISKTKAEKKFEDTCDDLKKAQSMQFKEAEEYLLIYCK